MLKYQSDPDRNSSKLTLCSVFAKEKNRKSKVRPKVLLGLGKSKKENKNNFCTTVWIWRLTRVDYSDKKQDQFSPRPQANDTQGKTNVFLLRL